MNALAVVVTGDFENFEEKLIENAKQILEKEKRNDILFYITDNSLTDKCIEELTKKMKVKVETIKSAGQSPADIVYKAKQILDAYNTTDFYFIVSEENSQAYEIACEALFSPVYNISVHVVKNVEFSNVFKNYTFSKVVDYLHSIPSTDDKQVALFHSKLFPSEFIHGYSSRTGGISTHPGLASLNLCYSLKKRDSRTVVMENRARLAKAAGFKPEMLYLAKAVHGKDVWVYEEKEPVTYDAIVTKTPGVVVAAPGADCNMLLFADLVTHSCGAAHAGWKGILCGIIESTVNEMIKAYGTHPKDLIVSIGPSLSVCCCEFGVEESKKFLSIDERCVVWKENAKKPFLDLRLAAKILLMQCGVKLQNIDDGKESGSNLNICTKCDPDHRFFSFRRIGPQFGNQIGFIGIKNIVYKHQ